MGHQSAREQADRHVETTARRTPAERIFAEHWVTQREQDSPGQYKLCSICVCAYERRYK